MTEIKPIPDGYTSVTPWIIGQDTAGLMDFLARAFGAVELSRMSGPDGKIQHAEMRIGGAVVMMFDVPADWPPTPAFLRLYVEDAEAVFDTALAAGATPVTRPTHLAFGDRVGRVRDRFGNLYWLQQRLEEVSEAEMMARWSEPKWVEAMAYVQGSLLPGD
ncbi:MAG: VOC family protein [Devosia sp.]